MREAREARGSDREELARAHSGAGVEPGDPSFLSAGSGREHRPRNRARAPKRALAAVRH